MKSNHTPSDVPMEINLSYPMQASSAAFLVHALCSFLHAYFSDESNIESVPLYMDRLAFTLKLCAEMSLDLSCTLPFQSDPTNQEASA